jgi:lysophospholipase L1-like esterase
MQGGKQSQSAGRRTVVVWVHVLLVLLTAMLAQRIILQRANTLYDNGRWESSKVGLEYGILGAVAFLTTRTALHRDRLDLGVWHGYQELLRRDAVALAGISARVRLDGPGYLVVVVDKTEDAFTGVRVSTDPAFPAACLHGDDRGVFQNREDLDVPLLGDAWHRLSLERVGDFYRVEVDGREVGRCRAGTARSGQAGFRSGASDHAWVDDVVMTDRDGGEWREDFANRRHARPVLGAALASVGAVLGLVLVATRGSRRRQGLGATPYLATTHVVLLATVGLAWVVDTVVIAPRHLEEVDFRDHTTTFERRRDVVPRLADEVVTPRPEGVFRILALGGSQTWGSGARDRSDTWFEQLESRLNADAGPGERVEIIGAGIPAYTAKQLYSLLMDEWLGFDPQVLLLNLGHNDKDPEVLVRWTRAMAQLAAERGIRTVVVPEANSVENRGSLAPLLERHAALLALAGEMDLPVIDTHAWLAERRDDGFLWWDRVHLTPAGQVLLAERLFEERARLLGR